MGIRFFLKAVILVIAFILNLVSADSECTYNESNDQWNNCNKKYNLFNAKCAKGTACAVSNSGEYLFKCSTVSSCSEVIEVGYYLNESENELFKCKNKCKLITESPGFTSDTAFYLDGDSKSNNLYNKLIKCEVGSSSSRSSSTSGGVGNNNKFNCQIVDNPSANTTTVNHYISIEEVSDGLITCIGQGCYLEEKSTTGYFINANSGGSEGKIIVCEDDGDCDIAEDDVLCYGVGDVIVKEKDGSKKAYFCTSDSENEKDLIEIQTNYGNIKYISITVNNPFGGEDDDDKFLGYGDGSKICIKIGDASVVKADDKYCPKECAVTTGTNCVEDSYYLVHSKTHNVITDGSGLLYYCNIEKDCKQITETGYYIVDNETIYFCSSNTCIKDTTVSKCDNNGIGRMVYENNKLSICLDGTAAVEILKSNNGNYMVTGSGGNNNSGGSNNGSSSGGNTDGNILFASKGKFGIITIKDQTVTLNSKYNNNMKYVYVNNSPTGNQKIMEKGDTCPKEGNTSFDVLEFECSNGICTKVN